MSPDEPSKREPVGRGARWRRRLGLLAAVLAGLVVGLRVALPYAIERAVPIAAERFGFQAALDNVDLALLRGHVALEGLRVTPLAPTTSGAEAPDLLRLGRLFVDLEWSGLLGGALEIAELTLERPELALVRAADGYLELPALPPSTEPKREDGPDETEGEPMPVLLHVLTVRDTAFRLVDATGGGNLLDFELAELGLGELRVEGADVGLADIRVAAPQLSIRREIRNTHFGARGATPEATEAEAEIDGDAGSEPPGLRIDAVAIERAEFAVVTEGEPVALALHLDTRDVSFEPDAPFPLELAIEVGEGSLTAKGALGLNPIAWDGHVAWERLPVPLLVRAGMPELIPWIRSCSASGDLDVTLTADAVRVRGRGGIDEFQVTDPEEELAIGWTALAIELDEARVPLGTPGKSIELAVTSVTLDAPRARYVLPNTAVERLGASTGGASTDEPAPGETAESAPEPRVRIETIRVRDGRAEFVDRSGDAPYQGDVRDFAIDVDGLRLPERTVTKLRVRGLAPEGAPFDLQAALPGTEGNARLALERLPLAQFTPYAERAAGLSIPRGALTLDTTAVLTRSGGAGEVDTKVRLHDLALDGATDAVTVAGMPLDLVLALLRDPAGDIALPVPFRYGEGAGATELATILTGALTAAVKGAVSSPLKAAGMLLPEGDAAPSLEAIAFAPGDGSVPKHAGDGLERLATLLEERPSLGLRLRGSAGPEDRDALAERILVERTAAGKSVPELEGVGFFARRRVQSALAARARGEAESLEPEDAALLARYVAATPVPPERTASLAQARAEAVRAALEADHGVGEGRLEVEAEAAPGPPQVSLSIRLGEPPAEEP